MKTPLFSEQELSNLKTEMLAQHISAETIEMVLANLNAPAEKNTTSAGIKIALKRKANALGVSYAETITGKCVTLHSFTGSPDDFCLLKGVAAKNGYSLN